jgi:hypothetical protein
LKKHAFLCTQQSEIQPLLLHNHFVQILFCDRHTRNERQFSFLLSSQLGTVKKWCKLQMISREISILQINLATQKAPRNKSMKESRKGEDSSVTITRKCRTFTKYFVSLLGLFLFRSSCLLFVFSVVPIVEKPRPYIVQDSLCM